MRVQGLENVHHYAPPFRFHRTRPFAVFIGSRLHRVAADATSCRFVGSRGRSHTNRHGIAHVYHDTNANRPTAGAYHHPTATHSHRYAANPYSDTHCYADTISYTHTDGHASSHTAAHRYSGAYSHACSNPRCYTDSHTHADTAPDSAAEANRSSDTDRLRNRPETRRVVGGQPPGASEPTQSVTLDRRRRGPLRA